MTSSYDDFEAIQHMRGQLWYMEPPMEIWDKLGRWWLYDGWITDNGRPTEFILIPLHQADRTEFLHIPVPNDLYWDHFPFYKKDEAGVPEC